MAARAAGVLPDWFWAATPCELAMEIEAQGEIAKGEKAKLWMQAALVRQKTLPAFNTFTGHGQSKPRKQTWQEMQAFMRSRFAGPSEVSHVSR